MRTDLRWFLFALVILPILSLRSVRAEEVKTVYLQGVYEDLMPKEALTKKLQTYLGSYLQKQHKLSLQVAGSQQPPCKDLACINQTFPSCQLDCLALVVEIQLNPEEHGAENGRSAVVVYSYLLDAAGKGTAMPPERSNCIIGACGDGRLLSRIQSDVRNVIETELSAKRTHIRPGSDERRRIITDKLLAEASVTKKQPADPNPSSSAIGVVAPGIISTPTGQPSEAPGHMGLCSKNEAILPQNELPYNTRLRLGIEGGISLAAMVPFAVLLGLDGKPVTAEPLRCGAPACKYEIAPAAWAIPLGIGLAGGVAILVEFGLSVKKKPVLRTVRSSDEARR